MICKIQYQQEDGKAWTKQTESLTVQKLVETHRFLHSQTIVTSSRKQLHTANVIAKNYLEKLDPQKQLDKATTKQRPKCLRRIVNQTKWEKVFVQSRKQLRSPISI